MTKTSDWKALSAALDHALTLGTQECAAWLVRLQESDAPLALRVRRLLGNRAPMAEARFLQGAAHDALDASPAPALLGAHIGPYVIEAEAGRGGMGSVWRARRDDGHYEGVVAIKFLNLTALDTQGARRFRREGLLLGKLDHPNVARLLDAGVQRATKQPYLVLEYVDGLPLDTYCEQRGLDLAARLQLFTDVLQAVAHAHSHLVIHGDIKPSNILVTRAGVVKLLDFGIARLADEEANQTHSSVAPLTPQYAAPEQVLGQFVTTRTDTYGLGLVLYRLLTGRHAVQANTLAEQHGGSALLAEILDGDPPAPSAVSEVPTLRRQDLAGDLDNIVAKAIRKNPSGRYQSAGAFADDLQRFLRHQPVTARRDTLPYRIGKFVRRHRAGVLAASLSAVALLGAVTMTTQQMYEARRQRDTAVQQGRRADAAADFLQLVLAENRPAARPLTVDELLDRAADLLEMQYGDNRAFVAEMYMLLAGERTGRNEVGKAKRLSELASASAHLAGDRALGMRAECQLVFLESGDGMKDAARERMSRTGWSDTRPQDEWQTEVQCLRAEANLISLEANGRPRSLELLERAKRIIEREGVTHERIYTTVISHMAVACRAMGNLGRALELVRLGGAIHEKNGRGRTRSRLLALNNEAVILFDMGEARASHEARQRLMNQVSTLDPSGTRFFNTNYAISATRMREFDAAQRALDGVAENARQRGDLLQEIDARLRMLTLQQRTGAPRADVDASFAMLDTLMSDPKRQYPDDQRYDYAEEAARREVSEGNFASARGRIAAALENMTQRGNPRYVHRALRMSAELALEDGDARAALDFARRGREVAQGLARAPDSSADVGELLFLEARAAETLGNTQSLELYERALRCFENGYGPQHPQTLAARQALQRDQGLMRSARAG
jgi:serine/threonine-protein kinase